MEIPTLWNTDGVLPTKPEVDFAPFEGVVAGSVVGLEVVKGL